MHYATFIYVLHTLHFKYPKRVCVLKTGCLLQQQPLLNFNNLLPQHRKKQPDPPIRQLQPFFQKYPATACDLYHKKCKNK
jgi:hypothetical protein